MSVESEGGRGGVVEGVRVDVRRLYDSWMELLFPRQLDVEHSVLGRWQPETTRDKITYWGWAAVGVPLIAVAYPLALLGFAARFYSRRVDSAATRLGVAGVVIVALVVWGTLTVATYYQLTLRGFVAVASASVVAVISAGLAAVFSQRGGRASTVILAYPFAVTAIFLPPVVAALYSPTLAAAIFPESERIAVVILNDVMPAVPVIGEPARDYLRGNYELVGAAYVLMWAAIAVPVGWVLGTVVTLADVVRPKRTGDDTDGSAE